VHQPLRECIFLCARGVFMPAQWFPKVRVLPDITSLVRHSARTEYEGKGPS